MTLEWHIGDTRQVLATLEPRSVNCVVTSPPYLAKRSYMPDDHPDKAQEMGQEATPAAFLTGLIEVMDTLWDVLADDGVAFVNLGDSAAFSGGSGGDYNEGGLREGQARYEGTAERTAGPSLSPCAGCRNCSGRHSPTAGTSSPVNGLDPSTPAYGEGNYRTAPGEKPGQTKPDRVSHPLGAPPLNWQAIPPSGFPGSHYATMPMRLASLLVKAACPPDGVVLDPFAGSGTTLEAAFGLSRSAVGVDLDERNLDLCQARLGMLPVTVHDHRIPAP